MVGNWSLTRTVFVGAAIVTLCGASLLWIRDFGGDFGISRSSDYPTLRSVDPAVASFALRFAEAATLANRPSATDTQVEHAKASLANALNMQQSIKASPPQEIDAANKTIAVPVPRVRPPEAQFAQTAPPAAGGDQQSSSPDDAVKTALRKVLAFLQPSELQLASVAPDGGVTSDGRALQPGAFDKHTAVYDITARVVHMPDGTRLEAHSGLGEFMDDPTQVAVKNRGPTPPNVYTLKMRERRFHGVQAIRMTPVGSGDLFGRTGLLTHSYLMGPNGDSNGCVSFKNYDLFLNAFLKGDVKRLVVVKSLSDDVTVPPAKA